MNSAKARVNKKQFIGLFSGCGGLDLGFTSAGFECLASFDIDPTAVQTHAANIAGHARCGDLSMMSSAQILSFGEPDVLVSGSPCQGFSTIGTRNFSDPRNTLLLRAGQLACEIKPKVFIAENVSGVLAGAHKKYWDQLCSILNGAGYQTATKIFNAGDFGIAQNRKRAVLFAWNTAKEINTDFPTLPQISLKEALEGVETLSNHQTGLIPPSARDLKIAKYIKAGQKLCNVRGGESSVPTWKIPSVFGATTASERKILEAIRILRRINRKRDFGDADPVSLRDIKRYLPKLATNELVKTLIAKQYLKKVGRDVDLTNTFNGKYRRLEWTSRSLTVDTRFGQARYFIHPTEQRGFSVREAARIQGFPDNFIFPESRKDSFRLIGNAVPPPMAFQIANIAKGLLP